MKHVSTFSTGNSNCLAAEYVEIPHFEPGEFVELTDTESKTGDGVRLLMRRDEWEAFLAAVKAGEFEWESLKALSQPKTPVRIAGAPVVVPSARRTPEALAYVNGQHAERSGWVPYDLARFCRRFKHNPEDPATERLFAEFQRGRLDEARALQGVGTERPVKPGA